MSPREICKDKAVTAAKQADWEEVGTEMPRMCGAPNEPTRKRILAKRRDRGWTVEKQTGFQ